MAKTASVMTPRSRPMFRMTSSISPRVFIRMPIADASRQSMPHGPGGDGGAAELARRRRPAMMQGGVPPQGAGG